jgi:hypothetical protein
MSAATPPTAAAPGSAAPDPASPPDRLAARVRGLRANALAATVMLLLQYGLGMWVALHAAVPAQDQGMSLFAAYGSAIGNGPVALSLHAILGSLLLISATAAVVRSSRLGAAPAIALTAVGLLAILVAWIAGSRFVGHLTADSSFTMAIATAVALLAYALTIFVVTPPRAAPAGDDPR